MPDMPDTDAALEAHLDDPATRASSRTRRSCASRASRRCPTHADDCRRAAEWLADALTAAGLEHVEVVETGGHPVVYADWLHAAGAPTVLVYGHYDVQPVDPLDLWTSPPFEPVVVGDRMLARGAADDKGQIHAHVMAAAGAAGDARRPADQPQVRVRGRGGVELRPPRRTGSRPNRERLAADVAIISDTGFFEGNLPAITLSLRGLMYAQIDVVGTAVDLHSGGYGGAVQNPANALAQIIAALKGPDGRIRDPGLLRRRRAAVRGGPRGVRRAAVRRGRVPASSSALPALVGEAGFTTARAARRAPDARRQRHLGRLPGRGQQDDHPGPRPRQGQLPAGGRPGPRPDLRGVPRPTSSEIAPPGVTTTVQLPRWRPPEPDADRPPGDAGRGPGARGDLRAGAGLHPRGRLDPGLRQLRVDPRPAGRAARLHASRTSNAHAPNEWMDLDNYETGIRTIVRMWDELADLPR